MLHQPFTDKESKESKEPIESKEPMAPTGKSKRAKRKSKAKANAKNEEPKESPVEPELKSNTKKKLKRNSDNVTEYTAAKNAFKEKLLYFYLTYFNYLLNFGKGLLFCRLPLCPVSHALVLHPRCKRQIPGVRQKDIEHLWRQSKERKFIVDNMSPSEVKRRRY